MASIPIRVLASITVTIILSLILRSNLTYATASTLTLTIDSATLSLNLKPISANGTFASSSNLNIGANTNNYTGYILKIAAKTLDDRNLSDKDSNNNNNTTYFAPIPTATTLTSFSDDTASGAAYNNRWGYLPSRYCTTTEIDNTPTTTCSNNNNNTFLPAPDTTGDILDITSTANASTATSDNNNYTIAIGARATTSTKASAYEGTFVIQMVANATPYTITYNKNTEDTVTNMPENETSSVIGDTATISNTIPTRSGFVLAGWCTEAVADGATCDSPNTKYNIGGTYTLDQTAASNSLNLYAMWADPPTDLTFKVGDSNIDTIIVADSSQNYKPFYVTNSQDVVFTSPTAGTKYIVTVVPKPNYRLDSWDRLSYAGTLASDTLLTTTYIAGSIGETFTANSIAGSYTTMQDLNLTASNGTLCPTTGANVTDSRDGKSYTVAKFGNYCYMLSNLRLDGSTNSNTVTLKSDESDVSADFVMPNQTTWTSGSQNHYCEARMRYINNEYYYNWYAAKANLTTGLASSTYCATVTYDDSSLGSICPKNWTLPNYSNDIIAATLWNSGADIGMLNTAGLVYSGSQRNVGSYGYWWSSSRSDNTYANLLYFVGTSVSRSFGTKDNGLPVRCMRSN